MSNFNDIKNMWQAQKEASLPPVGEIVSQARKARTKMIARGICAVAALTATVIFLTWIVAYYEFEYITTRMGAVLVILAVIGAIVLHSQLLNIILKRTGSETSSREYLAQLLLYRKKQQFIQTTGMTIYFIALAAGLALYLFEFLVMDTTIGVIAYACSFAWVIINWVWIRPRTVRKQQKQLEELIVQAEQIMEQMKEQQ